MDIDQLKIIWHNVCLLRYSPDEETDYLNVLIKYERNHEINIWQLNISFVHIHNHLQFYQHISLLSKYQCPCLTVLL